MRRLLWIPMLSVLICLVGCNKVDDYFLGKDNTPAPSSLKEIKRQVQFEPLWSVKLGGNTANAHDKLAPAVENGVIYVALTNGRVEARSLKTGELHWSQKLASGITSGPAVGEQVLAVGTRASTLVLLNQKDGQVRWEKKLSGELLAQPVMVSGKVFAKTVDGNVYAFSLADGHKLFRVQHGSPELILKASSSPVVMPHQHWLLVGFSDGKLATIDYQNGQVIWEKPIVFSSGASDVERLVDIDADPIIYQHSILLGTYQGVVGAISLENGEFTWQKTLSVYKNMALAQGRLYISDDSDHVWSLDPTNGQVLWRQTQLKVRRLTSPVVTPYGVLVGDKMGWLHLLSAREGALIGRHKLGGSLIAAPVVVGNRVIVLTQSGQLYAVVMKR